MGRDESDVALVQAARGGEATRRSIASSPGTTAAAGLLPAVPCRAAQAEDAAQEAGLRALLHLATCANPSSSAPGWWASGPTSAGCRRRSRASEQRALVSLAGEEAGGQAEAPDARVEATDLATSVRAAVGQLPEGQRIAVQLFCLSGLTYAQTARQLGIEVGVVRTRLHKARATLRRDLRVIDQKEGTMSAGQAERETVLKQEHVCSFCGKRNDEVRRMIAGPKGVDHLRRMHRPLQSDHRRAGGDVGRVVRAREAA